MDKPVLGSRMLAWLLPDLIAEARRSGLARRFWIELSDFWGLLEGLGKDAECDRAGPACTGLVVVGREESDAERWGWSDC